MQTAYRIFPQRTLPARRGADSRGEAEGWALSLEIDPASTPPVGFAADLPAGGEDFYSLDGVVGRSDRQGVQALPQYLTIK